MSAPKPRTVYNRLRKSFGPLARKPRPPIVDELVLTVLSQNTSDANSGRAFAALRRRYPSWDHVADAPTGDIADTIRSGGLADIKAPRIQKILEEIRLREDRIDLARLNDCDDDAAEAYLSSLPGVGPKTVACVLTFAMGRPAFPIDTHVHRIAVRLGWITPATGADKAHRLLTPRIPAAIRYELHLQLIRHGREVCSARAPACSRCVLFDLCEAGPRLVAGGDAR